MPQDLHNESASRTVRHIILNQTKNVRHEFKVRYKFKMSELRLILTRKAFWCVLNSVAISECDVVKTYRQHS